MIEVLFFGKMADVVGLRSQTVTAAEGKTLHVLRDRFFAGGMASGRVAAGDIRMSVNKAVVKADQPLSDGDEVAFFSVFSGG